MRLDETTMKDHGAFLLRASLGTMYLAHAWLKVAVFTLPGTAQFFAANGFPGWTAYAVVAAELAAGLALILGWRVRTTALAMLPVLVGATLVHVPNGWVFSAPNGGWEYPAFLTAASLAQSLLGAGSFALDRRTARARTAATAAAAA